MGSLISRGTISVADGVLEEVVREARVFDLGRKGEVWIGDAAGEEEAEKAG